MLSETACACGDGDCCYGCGILDCLRDYWKYLVPLCWVLAVCLLVPGIVQHEADYSRFHKLNGFEITARWVVGPRIRCPYGDKYFDCYDGLVMGNYTWNGIAQHCQMNITTQFQADDAQAELLAEFPHLGGYDMWSASPEQNNQCARSVDPHWTLIGFGITFTAIAFIATMVICITCCRERIRQHKRNIHKLNMRPPPPLRFHSAQLTLAPSHR